MADYEANRSTTKTLTGTTPDTVTLGQRWPSVEVINHDTTEWLWITMDGETAVAEADNAIAVPPSSGRVIRTHSTVGLVGNGNKYTVAGVQEGTTGFSFGDGAGGATDGGTGGGTDGGGTDDGGGTTEPDPLANLSPGDPYMDGYFVGVMDTTQGNIQANDASQEGARYALIISDKSLEALDLKYNDAATDSPAAANTRWDGLTATQALAADAAAHPAADYCAGLSRPADDASDWYLPAMDELALIYRMLKGTTEANYVGALPAHTGFPGAGQQGVNPSSDPPGVAYTASDPAQTEAPAFKDGGGQHLGASGTNGYYWSSTEEASAYAWMIASSGSLAGYLSRSIKSGTEVVRPVRRLLL